MGLMLQIHSGFKSVMVPGAHHGTGVGCMPSSRWRPHVVQRPHRRPALGSSHGTLCPAHQSILWILWIRDNLRPDGSPRMVLT